MTQNVYDNEEFFDAYSRLARSVHGLDGAPEWPALRALMPDMKGLRVLDLGCGYGWFCRWARQNGAARVLGIDVSEKMLQRARAGSDDDGIVYQFGDLEHVKLPDSSFDLVYSSLAFHYLVNLRTLVSRIHAALVPGGRLVFSVEHPIVTASIDPEWLAAAGRPVWPVDHYFDECPRSTNWLVKGVIKHHRSIGTYLNMLVGAGFTIVHAEDWAPTKEQIAARPEWERERERPLFFLVAAHR
jgi:SAM-dependent methyltransferase